MSAYLSHTDARTRALTDLRASMDRNTRPIPALRALDWLKRRGLNPYQSKQALTDAKRRAGIVSKQLQNPARWVWTTESIEERLLRRHRLPRLN